MKSCAKHNPRLIYAALTGYGREGKYAALAGHDINYLALSGVLDLMGSKDSPPALAGIQIADLAGGSMQAVIGILLALEARHRTGRGQRVDVSMFDGSAALLPIPVAEFRATGQPPERGNRPTQRRIRLLSGLCRGRRILCLGRSARAEVLAEPMPRTRLRRTDRRSVRAGAPPIASQSASSLRYSMKRPRKTGSRAWERKIAASPPCAI